MSSLQMLLDLADDMDCLGLSPYYRGDFGLGLHPYQIQRPSVCRLPLQLSSRLDDRQGLRRAASNKSARAVSNVGKDGFQVCMDVQQFKPSELSVKVVDDAVVVEGKHEEREDEHGYISRHFMRRYALPKNYDSDKVISTLSSDGILTVSIPKPAIEDKSNEKVVPIQQTGPAHLNVKENAQEKQAEAGAAGDKAQNGGKK